MKIQGVSVKNTIFQKIQNRFYFINKTTLLLVLTVFLILGGGFLGYQKFVALQKQTVAEEQDLIFDPEGPYALLFPRRDGNALILNLKRTSSYDEITYELAYTSLVDETVVGDIKKKPITDEGEAPKSGVIDRGVVGTIDTKQKKGEYEQEILLGTCSKNICKYDKGVENGTLTLHIKKGNERNSSSSKAFRMITEWHLQKPAVALGVLTSGDNHLTYKVESDRETLANVGFSIINDLTGVPKLPSGKEVLGKVYALNLPIAKQLATGIVTVELVDDPPLDAKLATYDEGQNKWVELETTVNGSKLSAKADGAGIFAVLVPQK